MRSAFLRPAVALIAGLHLLSLPIASIASEEHRTTAHLPEPTMHEAMHASPPEKPAILAPGYGPLSFVAPQAGSYRLPSFGEAPDGKVLGEDGELWSLHDAYSDKVVVLSFIFTTCHDINGCPLATYVMQQVQSALQRDPKIEDSVRLVSFSFDPELDTPEVISAYGNHFRSPDSDWVFLTTTGTEMLQPTLDAYGQWVIRDYDESGAYLGTMSHILRVFLIDKQKRIRNIYSTSFLHADTVFNDIQTVLMQPDP